MTTQGYKYLSPPSAHTVGILLFTRCISTSLSRIAIHKGLSRRCDSTWASRTYIIIFVSGALCGIHSVSLYDICTGNKLFQVGLLSIFNLSPSNVLYSSTIPQGSYNQNSGPIWCKAWSNTEEVPYCQIARSQGSEDRQIWPKLGVSGLLLQFEFTDESEMIHKA